MTARAEGGRPINHVKNPVEIHGNSTAHPFDAPLDVRLNNLRAWKLCVEQRGWRLSPVLEARLAALEQLADDTRLERASLPFRRRFPALHRWATDVLKNTRRHSPLTVAAAYELIAVQCEEAGQFDYAARVLEQAASQFTHHARSA